MNRQYKIYVPDARLSWEQWEGHVLTFPVRDLWSRTIDHNTKEYVQIRTNTFEYVRIRTNTYEYVRIRTNTYTFRKKIIRKSLSTKTYVSYVFVRIM